MNTWPVGTRTEEPPLDPRLIRILVVVEVHGQRREYRDEDGARHKHVGDLRGCNTALHRTAHSRDDQADWIDIHEFLGEYKTHLTGVRDVG